MKSVHVIIEHLLKGISSQTEEEIYQICGNEDSAMKLLQFSHSIKTLILIHVA